MRALRQPAGQRAGSLRKASRRRGPVCPDTGAAGKKCFLLEVRNRTDLSHMDEFLARRKHPVHGHGIGLLNVQDVIRQCDGTLHMELQEGCFIITLPLPMTLTSRT